MSETQDDGLKRLFAQAPTLAADEVFVATVAVGIARRRRAQHLRRAVLVTVCAVAAIGLAILLAPVAPPTDAVLVLPDRLADVAASRVDGIAIDPWISIAFVSLALPLLGAAWLARRVR